MDYYEIGVNGEPEHNSNSIWCWCAPRIAGEVVIHRTLIQIVEDFCAAQLLNTGVGENE